MTKLQDSDPVDSVSDTVPTFQKKSGPAAGGTLKLFLGIGIGMVIALLGSRFLSPGSGTTEPANEPVSQVSAQTVTVAPVQVGQVTQQLTVSGTVQAADLLNVNPQVGGLQIQAVLVQEGDRVVAGQPLIILDDTELRTQIQQAAAQIAVAEAQVEQQRASLSQSQALLNEAEVSLKRYQSLAAQGAVSQEELESRATEAKTAREAVRVAQANVASAEATVSSERSAWERLNTQLSRTTVTAPAAGIVAERPATVGSVPSPSDTVVQLIRNNELELAAQVPQAQLPQVKVGVPAVVTASTDPQLRLTGTVQEIQPLVDPETRTAQVIIRLPNSDRLRAGLFLTAAIQVSQSAGLTIPSTALLPQLDGSIQVFTLSPAGTAVARTVTTGARIPGTEEAPDRVEIIQGLTAGEQVIVAGAGYVQDGDVVTVGQ